MFGLSKADAKAKKELNDDADRLEASGDARGAENLRGIAAAVRPATKQPKKR
jgi:hypothetical protein